MEEKCSNCGQIIGAKNSSQMKINIALHLKKHEIEQI